MKTRRQYSKQNWILNKIELSKWSTSISNNSLLISLIPYSISFTVSRHIVSLLTLPVVKEEKRLRASLLIILTRITYFTTLGKYLHKVHNHVHSGVHDLRTHVQTQVIHVHEIGCVYDVYANLYWHTWKNLHPNFQFFKPCRPNIPWCWMKPYVKSTGSWKTISDGIRDLADCLNNYWEYLNQKKADLSKYKSSLTPAKTNDENSSIRHLEPFGNLDKTWKSRLRCKRGGFGYSCCYR